MFCFEWSSYRFTDFKWSRYESRIQFSVSDLWVYRISNVFWWFEIWVCGDAGDEIEERKQGNVKEEETELMLDAGFVAPHTNSFGQTFRYNSLLIIFTDCKIKTLDWYLLCVVVVVVVVRDYDAESERRKSVEEFYRVNHIGQTVEFVRKMREEYGKLNRTEMSIWECCELLNEFIDESDPDMDEPQIEHLLQTAEAIRKDYPDEDWLHLTGLIHGKNYIWWFVLISH